MNARSMCRIGVFYDGSYFCYAQEHLSRQNLGRLNFQSFHSLIVNKIHSYEPGFSDHRIVYAAWFQGMFTAPNADERQLRNDRDRYHDLMHAGIEPKYLPMAATHGGEKGVDVALAIDALQVGLEGKIDIAVLVTGDGDFVPLVHALMKHGIKVMAVYFEYEEGEHRGFINERLANVCSFKLNVSRMENDNDKDKAIFKGLFGKPEKTP